jgi:hypothetical protein
MIINGCWNKQTTEKRNYLIVIEHKQGNEMLSSSSSFLFFSFLLILFADIETKKERHWSLLKIELMSGSRTIGVIGG